MDLEIIILSEVCQKEKDKYHVISLICGILKHDTNKLIYKTEIHSHTDKTTLWLPKGIKGEGINYEFGICRYTLLYIK